jgi:hypothetical protein
MEAYLETTLLSVDIIFEVLIIDEAEVEIFSVEVQKLVQCLRLPLVQDCNNSIGSS